MRKIFFSIVIFAITALVAVNIGKVAIAAGSPLQISPFHGDGNSPCGVFYTPPAYSFSYNGGTVWLSGLSNGTGNIYTDDKLDIEVTRPDGTKTTFSKNYGDGTTITPTIPQDVTNLFKSGTNSVKVTMTDLVAPVCNSSEYWLVETTNGGGSVPAKPNVLPRSTWHGENNGVVVTQTPNHIAIHHARGTNDPGNIGTYARELKAAIKLKPVDILKKLFNPASVLSAYDSQYPSIRNSWTGQIWLEWLNHKYLDNYGDIAYHYLVDPEGKIYEGRWKGSLGENADNKGSSIWHANTGLIGITVLGRYGIDPDENMVAVNILDGGVAEPTNASIQSAKSLVDWLSGKYNINKTGKFQLPPSLDGQDSCKLSPDQCFVDNISGHKDFVSKTQDPEGSVCPGDNLYKYIPTLRGLASMQAGDTIAPHKNPTGILVGGFSPIELGIVDPAGKRLGIDPSTGQNVTNIANGIYGRVALSDHLGGTIEDVPYWLHVPVPVNGVYKIDVVGTGTGAFTLATEDLQTSSARAMNGSTTNGQKDNYQIIYNTSNPSQLELFHDTVPPVTTGTMTCSRDMNGTCRSAATVKLNATDTGTNGDPGSGVLKIECSYDDKTTWQQCGDATGGQNVFDKNEKKSFWYRSTDRVLNVETPKYSGIIDVQKYLSIADTLFKSDRATTLRTTGITQSNGNATFTYNTTVDFDVLQYYGTFSESGNTSFSIKQKLKVTQKVALPSYPLSYYKTKCTNYAGPLTIWDTSPAYNKCMYVTGDVTFNATTPTGKLTIVSEGYIKDKSTNANLQAWDTTNGILFYSAKGYTTTANGATYTGVIYAPTTQINGAFSNTTFNGSLYSKTVSFGSGTSFTAKQAAGFPATTYTLPL